MATIVRQIGTIARALDSIANVEFKQHQLARGQYLYLVRIAEHPGIIAEQLSKMLKVDRATVSRAIAKLVQCGLVNRQTAPDNQKVKHLYVTELGGATSGVYPTGKRILGTNCPPRAFGNRKSTVNPTISPGR